MWTFGFVGLFPIGLYTQKIWWMVYSGSLCGEGAGCIIHAGWFARCPMGPCSVCTGYGLAAWTGGFSWTPGRIYAMNKGYSV